MDQEIKAKWVAALRSGEYKQARETLRKAEVGFCCLGVLLDLSKEGEWRDGVYDTGDWSCEADLCSSGRSRFSITEEQESVLVAMNDGNAKKMIEPHSFAQIADYIEKNL